MNSRSSLLLSNFVISLLQGSQQKLNLSQPKECFSQPKCSFSLSSVACCFLCLWDSYDQTILIFLCVPFTLVSKLFSFIAIDQSIISPMIGTTLVFRNQTFSHNLWIQPVLSKFLFPRPMWLPPNLSSQIEVSAIGFSSGNSSISFSTTKVRKYFHYS